MDKDCWKVLVAAIRSADRRTPRAGRRPFYSDRRIVKMYFWCVAHDRPLCWACERSSYGPMFRPRRLPSVSQFCKRLKTRRIARMIELVHERLARPDGPPSLVFIDGKALPIGESSKDPDARVGRGNGVFSRGYKMHALGGSDGRVLAFYVGPLNEGEPRIARERLAAHTARGSVVLADGNYDSKDLYTAIDERGAVLLTPQKRNAGSEASMRRTSPARRRAMLLWRDRPELMRRVYALRGQIERTFSALTCFGGGLGPLPAWVRRLERVTRWVTAKVAIYNARVALRNSPS